MVKSEYRIFINHIFCEKNNINQTKNELWGPSISNFNRGSLYFVVVAQVMLNFLDTPLRYKPETIERNHVIYCPLGI